MLASTESEQRGSGHGTAQSGSAMPVSERPEFKRKDVPPDKHLRNWILIFGLLWLLVLVGLTLAGLCAMASGVDRHFQTPPSAPTATPTPSASPAATPTVASAQVDTAARANANSTAPKPSQQAATFAARQHFLILAVVTATMVLFPWVLLLAFAYQRAPRLYKDLKKDLGALGLYRGPEQMKRNLEKNLTATILPSLERTEPEVAEEYANLLLSYAQKKGTGTGGSRPSDIEESVWDKAYKMAEETRKGEDNLNTLESEIPKMIQLGLKLARENVATRYARQLVDRAMAGRTDPGPAPMLRISDSDWREAFEKARTEARPIAEEIKLEEERIGLKQRFGVPEFLLPLLSMTPIVLVSFVWAFWPEATFGFVNQMVASASLNNYFGGVVVKMAPAAVAVITAYLFMVFGLMRRYHRSDIAPGGYWEVLNRLIVVFLLGLVGSVLLSADTNGNVAARTAAAVAPTAAIALGILAGVFPVDTLRFLVKTGLSRFRKWLAGNESQVGQDLEKRLEKLHPLSLLDDLDPWDELRLTEEGIIGIQGMATADITHLLIWTPFTTQQIVDWVDQSILFLAAGAEPDAQYIKTFRKLGLRGASDLIDATTKEADRKIVVAAAGVVQKALTKEPQKAANIDPMRSAQLALSRVQLKVKQAQESATQVKDKKKDDPLDETAKIKISSAILAVRDARESIDSAVTEIKAGGETLTTSLDAANSLHAKFKKASEKAGDVEQALSAATEKVTEDLATGLKALAAELTGDPDANSQVQALALALDKIAKPLAQTEAKAREFEEKARAIQQKAESTQTEVPGEVGKAESLLRSLTGLAREAQKLIKTNSTMAVAVGSVDDLVKVLTDESADKPKNLLEELKKKDQWTATGDGNKARSYGNAEKLVSRAAEILKRMQTAAVAAQAVEDALPAATGMVACPPLTMEVLVTLLNGLERNPNLRRIQRYLTSEVAEILSPARYVRNIEWLGTTTPGDTREQRGRSEATNA